MILYRPFHNIDRGTRVKLVVEMPELGVSGGEGQHLPTDFRQSYARGYIATHRWIHCHERVVNVTDDPGVPANIVETENSNTHPGDI